MVESGSGVNWRFLWLIAFEFCQHTLLISVLLRQCSYWMNETLVNVVMKRPFSEYNPSYSSYNLQMNHCRLSLSDCFGKGAVMRLYSLNMCVMFKTWLCNCGIQRLYKLLFQNNMAKLKLNKNLLAAFVRSSFWPSKLVRSLF